MSQTTRAYAAVALGGAVGAGTRSVLSGIWPDASTSFPWTLFAINSFGCAALALVLVWGERSLQPNSKWHGLWRPFLATGVLGGFTTTSAFALAAVQLSAATGIWTAVVFIFASLIVGLAAFSAVQSVAIRWLPRTSGTSL